MSKLAATVRRDHVVETANALIEHLSKSGTREDQVKREAIIAVTSAILLGAYDNERTSAYAGFKYLDKPVVVSRSSKRDAEHSYAGENGTWEKRVFDDSRVRFL